GNIEVDGDVDYFEINITSRGTLTVETNGSIDTEGTLYNASGTPIATDNNNGANNNFKISKKVVAGTYYVRVSASGTGNYGLVYQVIADDHGDDRSTATSVTPGAYNDETPGNIEVAGDVDWFRIETNSTGLLEIRTKGSTDTYGELYDENNTKIAYDNDGGYSPHNFRMRETVASGTYYVKVKHRTATGTGNYGLIVQFTPTSTSTSTPISDDHGSTVSAATSVQPNSITAGRIEIPGDHDWFKIVLPSRGTLAVYTASTLDTYGYILDENGTQFARNRNGYSAGQNFKISQVLEAGTYYAKVRLYGTTDPRWVGDYTFVSHFETQQAASSDDYSNTKVGATAISPNSTTAGRINTAGDVDYFKITIPSAGTLVVNTTGSTDTKGTLLDTNGAQIASNDDNGSDHNFRISKSITASGTYYIAVKHRNAEAIGGSYSLVTQFTPSSTTSGASSDDYSNTQDGAETINPISTTSGNLEVAGDIDWFKIEISRTEILTVETTGATDTYGELYNENNTKIAYDNDGGTGTNFKITHTVTSGIYYVKVKHRSTTGTGSYSLVTSLDDYGNTIGDARTVSLGNTTLGNINVAGDEDYFKIVIPSAGTLTVKTTGSTDTYGYLLDASNSEIESNDDGGLDRNFQISKFITTAGTYYVKVKHH
ncbi:MAG: PPC domain-containing protein, partial [Sulfurovum sp.]|nr:PPC domain-containing protein [Sulfurovum sp.]